MQTRRLTLDLSLVDDERLPVRIGTGSSLCKDDLTKLDEPR
jgi:hypothetical protein